MTKEYVRDFYLNKDRNCAETLLLSINAAYELGLTSENAKLVGAWGGGAGCGITCGALAGSLAALGTLCIKERAHGTPGFSELCSEYVKAFEAEFGSTSCRNIKPDPFIPGVRCIDTVERAAQLFDRFAKEHGIVS
ncbi:MAG: C_GCAxxG_C_C family protein [Clostridia bacterium]|nr:C_GCAxxG_C_C family protein [Clostridia bacterium]